MAATTAELREAGTSTTTPSRLAGLASHEDVRVRVLCARHSGLPSDHVVALADDREPAVRASIAWRPGLPSEIVARLAVDAVRRVRRAAQRMHALDSWVCRRIIESGYASPPAIARLNADLRDWRLTSEMFDEHYWREVAAHGTFADVTVRRWIAADDRRALMLIAAHGRLSHRSLVRLARSPSRQVQDTVGSRSDLGPFRRCLVVLSGCRWAAAAILRSTSTRAIRFVGGLRHSHPVRVARAASTRSSITLRCAVRSHHFPIAFSAASNPACGRWVRRHVIKSHRWWALHEALARRTDLRDVEYRRLLTHPAVGLRLALNPSIPRDLVERLMDDRDPFVAGAARIHPARAVEDRIDVAGDLAAPAWVLRRLARDDDLPSDVRDSLEVWLALGGAHGDINFDPLTCSGTPGERGQPHNAAYMEQGGRIPLNSSLWRTRGLVGLGAGRLDTWIVKALATDAHPEVRLVAARYSVSATLKNLAMDPVEAVRQQAGRTSPITPNPRVPRTTWMSSPRWVRWMPLLIVFAAHAVVDSVFNRSSSSSSSNGLSPMELLTADGGPTWMTSAQPPRQSPDCEGAGTRVWVTRSGDITIDVTISADDRPILARFIEVMPDASRPSDEEHTVSAGDVGRYSVSSLSGGSVLVGIGDPSGGILVVPFDRFLPIRSPDPAGDC